VVQERSVPATCHQTCGSNFRSLTDRDSSAPYWGHPKQNHLDFTGYVVVTPTSYNRKYDQNFHFDAEDMSEVE
jgi:hypothetical protein